MVETAVVFDVDEYTLLDFLENITTTWKKQKGLFESGLINLLEKIGRKDDLLFAIHIFACGRQYPVIITLLTEYQRNLRSATVSIHANYSAVQIRGASTTALREFENRIKRFFDRFEDVNEDGTITFEEDFECPFCKARYSTKILVYEDGKVQCQNCAKLVEYYIKS
ncbi:MAG: hypothetical protein ACFFCT_05530 [Candidatus Odinarchaeota archaeon]